MKPQRDTTTQTNTLRGDDIAMGIDKDAIVHIMNVVTDLYADPELACIREYATNALDAHTEAGVTRPIEIELSSALRPSLTIRDFGAGLTHEDIREIYSQYGASTKRGTNDAVGMLGLGCKSALAYADQFTVTSRANGQAITVSVSRDERGAGTMTVLDRGACDVHESGTEVIIPTHPRSNFESKARTFFAYWPVGSVLLNGAEPEPAKGLRLGEDILVQDADYGVSLHLLMGNVRYPAPEDYSHTLFRGISGGKDITVKVPIGTVSFAPSREALLDTPAVRAACDEACERVQAAISETIKREISLAKDKPTALRSFLRLRQAFGIDIATTWRGEIIPTQLGYPDWKPTGDERPSDGPVIYWLGRCDTPYLPRNNKSEHRSIAIEKIQPHIAMWIVNYSNKSWSKAMRTKLDAYLEAEHGIENSDAKQYGMVRDSEAPGNDWLDLPVIDWADVRAWRDPAAKFQSSGRGKYAGTYDVIESRHWGQRRTYGQGTMTAEALAESALPLAYTSGGRYSCSRETADRLDGKYQIVLLPPTRVDKFRRLFPKAIHVQEAQQELALKWWRGLTDDKRRAYVYAEHNPKVLPATINQSVAAAIPDIEDPALRDIFEARKIWESATSAGWYRWRDAIPKAEQDAAMTGLTDACASYPLLKHLMLNTIDSASAKHLIMYVNTVYRLEQE